MNTQGLVRRRNLTPVWTLGDRIRKIRRDVADMTMEEFAESINVQRPALAAWEAGHNTPRSPLDIAERIEYVWGVPKWWTLGTDELPRRDSNLQPADYRTQFIQAMVIVWCVLRRQSIISQN